MKQILIFLISLLCISCSHDKLSQQVINKGIQYVNKYNMNTNYIIFVDFNKHSGKNRFYVYDLHKKTIILESLCAHGMGLGSTKDHPVFSNKLGSHCSSLGFYKVGGYNITRLNLPSYILEGLSSTNSNAKQRMLLIHPYYTISDIPTYPIYAPMNVSEGCFVISPIKFKQLSKILSSNKNICLYAYK